jgi:opacity protein-like surface antigen
VAGEVGEGDAARWRPEFGIAFQAGLPQGDFDVEDNFGAALFGGVGLPGLPVVIGVDFSFLVDEHDRTTLAENDFSSVVATTSSDITMLHLVARLQPATGRFRPYLDAAFGFKDLETRTRINERFNGVNEIGDLDDCFFEDCTRPVDNDKESSDTALSYGVGVGFDVELYRDGAFRAILVAGVRYLFGEEAKYVDPKSVRIIDANTVAFTTDRTRTDLLATQIGISLRF